MFTLNVVTLVHTLGYIGLAGIIFAESGLLVGFFLPGDSLLFTAGLFASQHFFNIWILVALFFAASVAGDNLGYFLGHRFGPAMFNRDESFFFRSKNVERAHAFFDAHGSQTIILARFIPVIRTFTPVFAGVAQMRYRTYFFFDLIGSFAWAAVIPLLGYYLGSAIPNIDHYILPIVALIVIISMIPVGVQYLRSRPSGKK